MKSLEKNERTHWFASRNAIFAVRNAGSVEGRFAAKLSPAAIRFKRNGDWGPIKINFRNSAVDSGRAFLGGLMMGSVATGCYLLVGAGM